MIHGFPYAGPIPQTLSLASKINFYDLLRSGMGQLGISPARVLYPCCGPQVLPKDLFGSATVVYLDNNPEVISAIEADAPGTPAFVHDALTPFSGAPVDIILLMNPVIFPEALFSNLQSGGYIFANNYHATAKWLFANEKFRLVGAQTQAGWMDQKEAQNFFLPIESDLAWQEKTKSPWATALNYKKVLALRAQVGGLQNTATLIEWYKNFSKQALDWIEKNVEYGDLVPAEPIGYNFDFRSLPTQKSTIDDCIIFEKL